MFDGVSVFSGEVLNLEKFVSDVEEKCEAKNFPFCDFYQKKRRTLKNFDQNSSKVFKLCHLLKFSMIIWVLRWQKLKKFHEKDRLKVDECFLNLLSFLKVLKLLSFVLKFQRFWFDVFEDFTGS